MPGRARVPMSLFLVALMLVACGAPSDGDAEVVEAETPIREPTEEVTAEPTAEAAEEEQPEPEPTPDETHATAAAAVEDYLNAWARGNYRAMRDVATGNAYLYASYLQLADRADPMLFGFSPPTISTGRAPGDVAEASETRVVFDGQATMTTDEDPTAVEFTDFVAELTDDAWRVADMVRDGRPLADFVADPTASKAVAVNAVEGTLVAAFHNPSENVVVAVVEIANNRDGEIDVFAWNADFVTAADSRQYGEGGGGGGGTIQPGARTDLVALFVNVDSGEQGGTLRVEVSDTQELNRFAFELIVPPFSGQE